MDYCLSSITYHVKQPQQQPQYHETNNATSVKRRQAHPQASAHPHHQGYRDRAERVAGVGAGGPSVGDPDIERGELPMESEEMMDNRYGF